MRLSYLFIAGYDSMNQPMAALARELVTRGNNVSVVAGNARDVANLMAFAHAGIEAVEVSRFPLARLDDIDIVVMAPVRCHGLKALLAAVRRRELFIVSFASLFSSVVMREYPDLVLSLGAAKAEELAEAGLSYHIVAVGNPQYDSLVRARHMGDGIERVLVIDQGGYPYGARGKRQLAGTVVAMAQANPQLRFDVKPRYYAQLAGRKAHEQTESLAALLRDCPANVRVLREPAQLEELVVRYDAVVTTWSTAYLDAALRDMPLIIVAGLESDEVFDVRDVRVQAAYEHVRATGCVHDWRELQGTPLPFARVDARYLEHEVHHADTPCCARVIAAIELAYETCVAPGRRWSEPFALDADEFARHAHELASEPLASPHQRAQHAYLVRLNALVQQWTYTNRCLGCPLDLRPFRACFTWQPPEAADGHACEQASAEALREAEGRWRGMLDAWFSRAETQQQIRTDAIAQDFFFEWLLERGEHGRIERYEAPVLARASRAYALACLALERGDTRQALVQAQAYLDECRAGDEAQLRQQRQALQHLLKLAKRMGAATFARFALRKGNWRGMLALARQAFGMPSAPALAGYALRMRSRLLERSGS